jgi:hypothetical protein
MGRLEQTDAIDAAMIAWFADVKHSAPSALARADSAASARARHAPAPVRNPVSGSQRL